MRNLMEVGLGVRATARHAEALGPSNTLQTAWRRRVIIVIPTLNEALHIGAVVRLLAEEIPESADACIVVVDGGSTDGTQGIVAALAREYPVAHCIDNFARVQSAGINLALQAFGQDAEVLIRCDAHASYPERYCGRLLDSLERSGADAVVVAMDSVGRTQMQRAVAWVSNSIVGTGGSAHRGGHRSGFVDHGHHAAFRVDTFRRAGGYDEKFTHNEDAEFDCRQRALGAKLYLDADIRVQYAPRSSWRGLARQYYQYGAGRSRTLHRHPTSIRLRQMAVPANLVLCGLAVCLSPWFAGLLIWPAAYFLALTTTSLAFAARRHSLVGLLTGPAAAVMHTAWAAGFIDGWFSGHDKVWQPGTTVPLVSHISRLGPMKELEPMRAILVDPSLYTAPYDAALTDGLVAARVQPTWAVRPNRCGDVQPIDSRYVDAFFYRHVDAMTWLPDILRRTMKAFAHVLGLTRLIMRVQRQKPDVVHFQWAVVPTIDTLAMLFIRKYCPVVLTVHDTTPFNGDRFPWGQITGHYLPMRVADRIIVHTEAGRQSLIRRGISAHKLTVIPHGSLQLPVQISHTTPRGDGRWMFLLFGEVKPYKGVDLFIEAISLLPESLRERARFVVAGRPRMDLGPLLARIAELRLQRVVELQMRRLSDKEMAVLFGESDCFVFPYRQIDASGVYSLVKPLPKWMIATNVGIFAEDLNDGTGGTLVPTSDPRALADALQHAINHKPTPSVRTSSLDWTAIGNATRAVYRQGRQIEATR